MTFLEIADIALIVLCAITYGLQIYFKVKSNVVEAVSELIALAETTGLAGHDKMMMVVEGLFKKIPKPLQSVLTKDKLETLAQHIFNWMRRYADTYAKVTAESKPEEREENMKNAFEEVTMGEITSLVSELLEMSLEELRKKAKEYGVDINMDAGSNEIVRAIIDKIIEKA